MLNREIVEELFHEWVQDERLRIHMRAVEVVMRAAFEQYGNGSLDADRWCWTGLLHDADYDRWPDQHPKKIVGWLREQAEPEMAHAVAAHTHDEEPASRLADALLACDELTGFVCACSLVRPEGIRTLGAKSVQKKLKDKAFAAGVDRSCVREGFERLQVEPSPHIEFVIGALQPHAADLGLLGRDA